jgi:hypothetical protein
MKIGRVLPIEPGDDPQQIGDGRGRFVAIYANEIRPRFRVSEAPREQSRPSPAPPT